MILREQKSPRCSHLHLHPEDLIDWTRHVLMSQFSFNRAGREMHAEDPPLVLPGGVGSGKDTG